MNLGVVLLLTVIILFGMMVAFAYLTRFLVKSMVGAKHQAVEDILSTGEIPTRWRGPYTRRVSGRSNGHAAVSHSRSTGAREAAKIRRKLDRLARYVARTRLVADEDARRNALDAIESVSRQWKREAGE